MSRRLRVEIWSDIVCPWCYVGKRRFEAALERFAHRDAVDVTWRAFELDPSAPRLRPRQAYAERLAAKYGQTPAQAQARIDQLVQLARAEGLRFDLDRAQPGNSFDAHRLLCLARLHGRQDALKERLLRAYFCDGAAIGDQTTLQQLANDVGLDADEVCATLTTDHYAGEVRADEVEARALGIHGVPFFVLSDRYAIEGAQPVELILSGLERAWAELPSMVAARSQSGMCGPQGCAP